MINKRPKRRLSLLTKIFRSRRWLSKNLGMSDAHKAELYVEICESVSLSDVSYWLQVIFAAGIATLGLVLNSPAVIIGAMLISPLMGGILANGLALATGDVILAVRATINLILSCGLAVLLALLLVVISPFQEMTSEIAARTQPTILDLSVALFSGAVGTVALCKKTKGIATSIPGVAIAVALMPPLCVVGYGIGNMISLDQANGWQVAKGGGLLFFTNLVAIIFTSMLIFLSLHLDTACVRKQVREWRATDPESLRVQHFLEDLPAFESIRKIGGLPGRFTLIFASILVISFPLNQSLLQVREQIIQKQQQNRLRSAISETWQQTMRDSTTSSPRSYINHLTFTDDSDNLRIQLQVVTSRLYTPQEQEQYIQALARRLRRNPNTIRLQLIEIPTSKFIDNPVTSFETPSIVELQETFLRETTAILRSLTLPSPAQMINTEIKTSRLNPLAVELVYLSPREIQDDAQSLITQEIRDRLSYPQAQVSFRRFDPQLGQLTFRDDQTALTAEQKQKLDQVGKLLQTYPNLQLEIISLQPIEDLSLKSEQSPLVQDYLQNQGRIDPTRFLLSRQNRQESQTAIALRLTVNPNQN
ncbi:MAG: DUF389 domain-containing protein [Snowella sp.]|nr:DUF389 domain-containing protein [Snowella sp.]